MKARARVVLTAEVPMLIVLLLTIGCQPGPHDSGLAALLPATRVPTSGSSDSILSETETKLVASDSTINHYWANAVAGGEDFDGDGYDDIIVGAYQDSDVINDGGSVYVFQGSSTGVDSASEQELTASDLDTDDWLGAALATGDLNGDGYGDIAVGAYQDDDNGSESGSVYVWYGSSSGIDSSTEHKLTASDGVADDYFGYALGTAGDLDADGYDDLVIGAYGDDDGGTEAGAAYVLYGSTTGVDSSREQKLTASDAQAGDLYGFAVSGGDLDGDGYDDICIGAYEAESSGTDSGAVYCYSGGVGGLDAASEDKLVPSDGAALDRFGQSLATGFDLNDDGYDDLASGAWGVNDSDIDAGAAYVYLGSSSGLDPTTETKLLASDGAEDDHFGHWVAGLEDLDADGYDDLAIGARFHDGAGTRSGAVYIYRGSSTGVDSSSEVELVASDTAGGDRLGEAIASAGDLNSDGHGDLVLGSAYAHAGDDNTGAAWVYLGSCHEDDASTWYIDADGDGYGDASTSQVACAEPTTGSSGWVEDDQDCDDGEPLAWTGADEVCDGVDNDCDGSVDPDSAVDATGWWLDEDGDGYGLSTTTHTSCSAPSGYVDPDLGEDCDDGDASISPGATEYCDGHDDDCDGATDEDDAVDASAWHLDWDGDDFGDPSLSTTACTQPSGTVADASDCDDTDAAIWPGADEYCDGHDDDCDGTVDEDDAIDAQDWHADADGDGYGDSSSTTTACRAPSGYLSDGTDCDDTNSSVNPAATERCDGVDNDCDGTADNDDAEDALEWFGDTDGDGYGDPNSTVYACDEPNGYVDDAGDCDDGEALAWTGASEVCDGADNDCDGTVDNDDAADATTWYADGDGDGYGDPDNVTTACDQPDGHVDPAMGEDCDDDQRTTHPGASDDCGDGVDADCDGEGGPASDEDGDGLSWTVEDTLGSDPCDDDSDGDGLSDGEDPNPVVADEADTGQGGPGVGCTTSAASATAAPSLWLFAMLGLAARRRSSTGTLRTKQ